MMLSSVQFLVFLLAVFACAFPAYHAIMFLRKGNGIGRVLFLFLTAEAINMGVAAYFAFNSYMGTYNTFSPYEAIALRLMIICTALFTTIYFVVYLNKRTKLLKG